VDVGLFSVRPSYRVNSGIEQFAQFGLLWLRKRGQPRQLIKECRKIDPPL
jgi:hypothetical protein